MKKHWNEPANDDREPTRQPFDPNRKWRADWAVIGWVGNKPVALVIEYEGTGFGKTGHTQTDGYAKNCQKYNRAALLGWTVLRYTCLSYEDLSADLKEYFKNLGA